MARAALVPTLVSLCLASIWLVPAALALVVLILVAVPMTRDHRGLSQRLFGAELVDIRAVATIDGWGVDEDDPSIKD